MSKKSAFYRLKIALKTDERIRNMNEIISGIQVIKIYTWEQPFVKLIDFIRR
jgi:ATP-binding cassette subfamily C (CFTR/MRP) protein 4